MIVSMVKGKRREISSGSWGSREFVVLEHSVRMFASRKFISNENGVENRPK